MSPIKCVSTCKQFSKYECNPPRCKYINGDIRRYCRLSSKYMMNKPKCNVTRRFRKKEKVIQAKKRIGEFLKRTGKVIQLVCTKSGECLSFGKKMGEITSLFKGFTGFEYVIDPIKSLGKPSANGFVKEIKYSRNGYNAYAVLKSSLSEESDNLVYEYLVGVKFINRIIRRFPCFLQTYGLYYYNTPYDHYHMMNENSNDKKSLEGLSLQNNINISKACRKSEFASILIQHIKSAIPIGNFLKSYNPTVKHCFVYILFIIYHALASLKSEFTHYDLHGDNVLLIEPNPAKFIHYKYHLLDGSIVEFFCPYIPKIIDYGRCFFDNRNINSKKIYQKICQTAECDDCGNSSGFQWLSPIPDYGISSQKKNESHDLRLLNTIRNLLHKINSEKPTNRNFVELYTMCNKIIYGVGIPTNRYKHFGTNENTKLHPDRSKVANVTDAYEYLKDIITHPDSIAENRQMFNNPNDIYGIFHIYEDGRPMEFI